MAEKRVFLKADFSEMGAAMGVISGMSKTMRSNRYTSDVITMTHGMLKNEFDMHMDALALAAPDALHHVYDWGQLGMPVGRLWRHQMIGNGATRSATWEWKASRRAVPTPEERADNPNDPMSQLDEEELSKFSSRRYFFYWKAPVMEYNTPVNVEPKNGKNIAFPVWDSENPMRFSQGVRIMDPGGEATTGKFTAAWVAWWSQEAPQRFDEIITPIVEKDLVETSNEMRKAKRSTRKTVTLNAMVGYEQAFNIGEDWAQTALRKRSTAYKRRFKE